MGQENHSLRLHDAVRISVARHVVRSHWWARVVTWDLRLDLHDARVQFYVQFRHKSVFLILFKSVWSRIQVRDKIIVCDERIDSFRHAVVNRLLGNGRKTGHYILLRCNLCVHRWAIPNRYQKRWTGCEFYLCTNRRSHRTIRQSLGEKESKRFSKVTPIHRRSMCNGDRSIVS